MATQLSPMAGQLYGITHNANDGALILRKPKVLKIGIGVPKGPALFVYLQRDPDGKVRWKLMFGYKSKDTDSTVKSYDTRAEAERQFETSYPKAPMCPYPRKLAYFTFTKPTVGTDGKERYVPDFDAIEAHGPTPTEIDILILDSTPFTAAYQMWSSSELRCRGNGIDAFRVVTLADGPEQKAAAQLAASAGEKVYPIKDGCWTCGCPYSLPTQQGGKEQPSLCKPNGTLQFQLAFNLRVGGTAFFTTTGFRSIGSIFSSLYDIMMISGGKLRGMPLKMVLRPFRSNHNGQSATHYSVSLEFRAPDVPTMQKRLMENMFELRRLAGGVDEPEVRMLEAGDGVDVDEEDLVDVVPMTPGAFTDEFAPQADGPGEPEAPLPAAAATAATTAGLAGRMAAARTKRTTAAAAVAETVVAPAPEPAPAAPVVPAPTATPAPGDMF